jgi:hypothetical protein
VTGRDFDPTQAGGSIRQLSTKRIRLTERGIDSVERHIGRFGSDDANQVMVDRLRRITRGEIEPTQYDMNFYAHELREYIRYRRRGFRTGGGNDYELWNNAHSATLVEYGLTELDGNGCRNLFHPDAWPFLSG